MIVVDTHALIWHVSRPGELSRTARATLIAADTIGIPAMTLWEIALLVSRRRVLPELVDLAVWFDDVFQIPGTVLLPLSPTIAIRAATLAFLRDPADCLIVATALEHHAPLVTKDDRIRRANVVETIW